MANPRIIFNSITLDLPEELTMLERGRPRGARIATSHGGITETLRESVWDEIIIVLERHGDRAFWRALEGWYAWASRGKQWSFARDSGQMVNTSLAGNESAGATIIEVVSIGSFAQTHEFIIESSDLTKRERHYVTEAGTPTSDAINIASPGLRYAYSAGDTLRHADYWPKLILVDMDRPFSEDDFSTYGLRIRAREDRA